MSKNNTQHAGVSRQKVKRRVGLIVLLFLIAGSLSYSAPANWLIGQANNILGTHFSPINMPFSLGLDLQGGTHLEYEADLSKVDSSEHTSAMEGVRDVIERRVNAMGVSEPIVQITRAGDAYRVSVELAGVRDINQAINMIGETPILEFKVINDEEPRQLTPEEILQLDDSEDKANAEANAFLSSVINSPENFTDLAKAEYAKLNQADQAVDLGFIKDKTEYAQIYESAKDAAAGTILPAVVGTDSAEAVVKVEEVKDASKEIQARHILIQWQGSEYAPETVTRTKEEALAYIQEIKQTLTPENFTDKASELSEEPGASSSGGELGWFGSGVMVEAFETAAFALAKGQISEPVETDFGYHLIYKEDERGTKDVRVSAVLYPKLTRDEILPPPEPFKRTELTGKQLERAQLEFNPQTGSAEVGLQFNDEGADLFAAITKANIGQPVAIYLDGEPISVPTVQSEILGGRAVITGNFTVSEAKLLAQRLQAGALPVPIELIAQQSVGPSLGKDSVSASLIAGLWGFLLVALFMVIFYRLPGLISVFALAVYGVVLFAVFKTIDVTLTLSGIAGLILSVGMAVDANVLIFERLKEELRLKKAYAVAIEEAFKRAWPSIRDGNLTTLISCIVLYWFTSSVIKGFALTLGIGVIISMFSAMTVTRYVLRLAAVPKFYEAFGWLYLKKSNKNTEE